MPLEHSTPHKPVFRSPTSLREALSGISPSYTYSEMRADAPRNAALGTYATEFIQALSAEPHLAIRFTATHDDYHRSCWIVPSPNS